MDGRDRMIDELRALVAKQAAQLEQQAAQLERQAARITELELELAKAKKDSTTSSKPPSSDITKPKTKKKSRGRRKKSRKGGQPGHEQHLRQPLPPDRVNETITHEIDGDEVKRLGLTPTGEYATVQHIELPDSPVTVTEYRLTEYQDANGNLYVPDCPELKGPIFGPRLLATIGWLKSVGHCSYSTIEAWMEDVLQVPVSRGYLAKLCTGPPSSKEAKNLAARFAIVEYVDEESSEAGQYDLSQDYFRFMFAEGVEPTNNHSEQQIRHCVIDRKITQGTRGVAGQRYHERMWTAIATCGKQNRNFFDFLHKSITASLSGQTAPPLMPF